VTPTTGPMRIPPLILERMRCPTCQGRVKAGKDGIRCPAGHLMAVGEGYVDGRREPLSTVMQKTFESFGYEWTRFHQIHPEDEDYWRWYFADVDLSRLADRVGLDAGCGKGRYSLFTANHLAALVALDGSDAVQAAAANLAGTANTVVLRSDLCHAPFAPESFGFVSCLGVLHHLEEPRGGFRALVGLLQPGGILLVYLYSRPRGWGLRAVGLRVASALRRITTGMPAPLVRLLALPLAALLWITVVFPGSLLGGRLGHGSRRLPLATYQGKHLRSLWLDTFDRLSAPIERRFLWEDVRSWYRDAGLVVDAVRDEAGLFILAHRANGHHA